MDSLLRAVGSMERLVCRFVRQKHKLARIHLDEIHLILNSFEQLDNVPDGVLKIGSNAKLSAIDRKRERLRTRQEWWQNSRRKQSLGTVPSLLFHLTRHKWVRRGLGDDRTRHVSCTPSWQQSRTGRGRIALR